MFRRCPIQILAESGEIFDAGSGKPQTPGEPFRHANAAGQRVGAFHNSHTPHPKILWTPKPTISLKAKAMIEPRLSYMLARCEFARQRHTRTSSTRKRAWSTRRCVFYAPHPKPSKPVLEAYLDFKTHNHKTHLDTEIHTREVSFLAWESRSLDPNSRRNRAFRCRRREETPEKVSKTLTWKPRTESGLDCPKCAEFTPQWRTVCQTGMRSKPFRR